jgi:hypothetical protein
MAPGLIARNARGHFAAMMIGLRLTSTNVRELILT